MNPLLALNRKRTREALTRVELLAVLGVLMLLAAIALPALAGGKPRSETAVCANNLRKLGAAALSYSMENEGTFPPRLSGTNFWPQQLLGYYHTTQVLQCPSDTPSPYTPPNRSFADRAPRSYLINGWNDYFEFTLTSAAWQEFLNYRGPSMPEAAIPLPSQTILFGEKLSGSLYFHMNLYQASGNDESSVEYGRHDAPRGNPATAGSNHAMADGSVRMLLYGQAVSPSNLWATVDFWRTNIWFP